MNADKINLTELRAEADDDIKHDLPVELDPATLLALIDAVEAARECTTSYFGQPIDRLRQTLDRFTP